MMRRAILSAWLVSAVCVDVRIDQDAYLDCLNESFRTLARTSRLPPVANPVAEPAPSLGLYNQAGIRQMLGTSFGRSIHPQRPAVTYGRPFGQ